ncbi:hypothetical protein NX801_04015 [Streptomyces sp. LP05-1]|uniref:Uncharacterized protein n=1 Tax=Streptomyces pyxinae TaxID=2970734 RepID=A0ABT2CBT6_9ACTN|nr:hypothetical protein [Streptomyces sp. LP05-1]MCS0634836.1 hypothetical protein [Streptomyces sp. LP05-1]
MPAARVRRLTAAVLTTAGAVVAALALTTTGATGSDPARVGHDWIAVKKTDTQPRTLRAGNSWTVYMTLHESENGKPGRRIGDASTRCSAVEITREGAITQCQRVFRTRQGNLVTTAMLDRFGPGPYTGVAAVAGGTGAYRHASGEARLTIDGERLTVRADLDG